MISAIEWVPKGYMKRNPDKYITSMDESNPFQNEINKEIYKKENKSINRLNENEMNEPEEEEDNNIDIDNINELPKSFKMDEYDQEDSIPCLYENDSMDDESKYNNIDSMEEDSIENTLNINNLDISNNHEEQDDEDDEEDKEDIEILPTDSIILVANTDEDYSVLEIHLYDENSGNLYIHHDITLPAFPLSLAYMDCPPIIKSQEKSFGNYVAVGTFKPGIEIWNLDVINPMEPIAVLGGEKETNYRNIAVPSDINNENINNNNMYLKENSHSDAVMCLHWNKIHRNMLASGSADHTVKLWDITTQNCIYTLKNHTDKVQSIRWNPIESTILASASFDKTIIITDGKNPDAKINFNIPAPAESLAWYPHNPSIIIATTEDGYVTGYDVRHVSSKDPYLFQYQAHTSATTSISFSEKINGLGATCSSDKTVKIWDFKEIINGTIPEHITTKEMNVGELFTMSFFNDSPYLLAMGGSKGLLALWDTCENIGVEKKFMNRINTNNDTTTSTTTTSTTTTNNNNNDNNNTIQTESWKTSNNETKTADEIAEELIKEEEMNNIKKNHVEKKSKKKKKKKN